MAPVRSTTVHLPPGLATGDLDRTPVERCGFPFVDGLSAAAAQAPGTTPATQALTGITPGPCGTLADPDLLHPSTDWPRRLTTAEMGTITAPRDDDQCDLVRDLTATSFNTTDAGMKDIGSVGTWRCRSSIRRRRPCCVSSGWSRALRAGACRPRSRAGAGTSGTRDGPPLGMPRRAAVRRASS